ncbi:hypothetical protein B9J90_04575 [Vibrio sp. V09_P4A23P171]|uniref:hypothetical protein n=1 Tax=Vibrio sp. V09_P4A23P171 TaxID=1938664 RepID=UPI000B8ECFE2|nr:hypothetical protein [Vibrio sp. V09_P4A23P171]OXX38084.1 hypothetical protein B9J90_04575 [Vibrio sp. V09_P4A23P171]
MKYKISPQYNPSGEIIIKLTQNTTDELAEILFSLPPKDHEGFNFTPQKEIAKVWKTEFPNEVEFKGAIENYRIHWSDEVNDKLDLFLDNFEIELKETLVKNADKHNENMSTFSPNADIAFTNIFPARSRPLYTCPKCRVERDKWVSPYNVGAMASLSLDQCSDVQALVTDEPCFFCRSNAVVSDYQDELQSYLVNVFRCNFFNSKVYELLGAKTLSATFEIEQDKVNNLNFKKLGIGTEVEILDLNLTSQGGMTLTELHGNSPILGKQDYKSLEASYYPTRLSGGGITRSNSCSLMITYLEKDIKEKNENFFQMLKAFIRRDSNGFVLRGSACVEQLLIQICTLELSNVPGKASSADKVSNVLTTSLSYSPQLQYLLPLICKANDLQPLSEILIGKLLTIKRRRDVIAHKGRLEDKNGNSINLTENEFFDYAATFSSVYGLLLQLRRKINT